MKETWKNHLRQLPDFPFLAVFAVYLIHLLLQSSTFYLPVPDKFLKNLFLILCLTLLFRIPVYLEALKTRKKVLAAALLLAVNYILVYHFGDHLFLLFSAVLTIGFFGMDYRKVLKLFSVILGCFLVLTFSAACCGAIEDFVIMKDGYIRTALGICYPTDMASYVLFFLMYAWAAWKRIPDLIVLALGVVCIFFSRFIAVSTNCTICSTVFSAIVLLHYFCTESNILKQIPLNVQKLARHLMIYAFPLLAFLMFILVFAYSRDFGPAVRLNSLLSCRLELALDAYKLYGLKAFGSPLSQNGNGFSTFAAQNYNFVDSTYPLILLRYGWILFLGLCFFWIRTTCEAFRIRDTRLACLLVMIAFHSFAEHHFIEPNFNVLVLLPFAAFSALPAVETKSAAEDVLQSLKLIFSLMVFTGIAAWSLPVFFTWMRTIIQICNWTGGGRKSFQVIFIFSIFYLMFALFAAGIIFFCRYIRAEGVQASKRKAAAALIAAALGLGIILNMIHFGNRLIGLSEPKYAKLLDREHDILQLITQSAAGKVYIDSVPAVYRKRFPEISNSLFSGEELARFSDTSVITGADQDSPGFINSGFLFTRISSRHILYTNDESVITALKEQGCHITGYYNLKKAVNLSYLSKINNLPYAKDTGLALYGNDLALRYGPYLSLYAGPYTAEFEFQLPEDTASGSEDKVALLRISAYNGDQILKEHVLKKEEFDANGHATVKVAFGSNSYTDIEFLVFPENAQPLNVSSIRYYRSPQYDVHMLYNKKRQKYREEYYTLEGEPTETAGGYSACEYEYDYDGRVTEIRYYDTANQPALLSSGYASVKRKLDPRGRIVLESYFGTAGEPVLCAGGYAIISREYDQDNNVIVQKHFDTNGFPVSTLSLYSEIHRVFNDKHQVILESYFDTEGKPFTLPQGYAMTAFQYDSSGRPFIQKYLDHNGDPVITKSQYAEIHREYTPQNWVSRESYYDTSGEPLKLPSGHSMLKRSFDSRGNAVLTEYCDKDGNRIMTEMHYSALQRQFNERNQIIYEAYLDANDVPVLMPENYSAVAYERNALGDAVDYKYFDQNGVLANRIEGYAEMKRDYNENRLPVRDVYLDSSGAVVKTTMQYAEIRREYNSMRQVIKESFFDPAGQPMLLSEGYSSISYEKDDDGNPVVIQYYDTDGQLTVITKGYAEIHRTYNSRKQITSESYFNVDHTAVACKAGFHKAEYTWSDDGGILKTEYYDIQGEPIT